MTPDEHFELDKQVLNVLSRNYEYRLDEYWFKSATRSMVKSYSTGSHFDGIIDDLVANGFSVRMYVFAHETGSHVTIYGDAEMWDGKGETLYIALCRAIVALGVEDNRVIHIP